MKVNLNPHSPFKKGFSLIELLIVLAITAILTSIAYPGYQHYLSGAKRQEGQAALLDLAVRLELYYSEYQTYKTATIGQGDANDILSSNLTSSGWYRLFISRQDEQSYSLKAIPQWQDKHCQTLTLNSLGEKGLSSAPEGTTAECW